MNNADVVRRAQELSDLLNDPKLDPEAGRSEVEQAQAEFMLEHHTRILKLAQRGASWDYDYCRTCDKVHRQEHFV